mmetsp:Transcript_72193/g.203995  ORF Transcript_72193/g.203995 Transcript_72193/m.203995 type:complete len:235 (-) Transcript_72193:413-1117(-)
MVSCGRFLASTARLPTCTSIGRRPAARTAQPSSASKKRRTPRPRWRFCTTCTSSGRTKARSSCTRRGRGTPTAPGAMRDRTVTQMHMLQPVSQTHQQLPAPRQTPMARVAVLRTIRAVRRVLRRRSSPRSSIGSSPSSGIISSKVPRRGGRTSSTRSSGISRSSSSTSSRGSSSCRRSSRRGPRLAPQVATARPHRVDRAPPARSCGWGACPGTSPRTPSRRSSEPTAKLWRSP